MNRILASLSTVALLAAAASAQVASGYLFTQSNPGPYVPLAAGTLIANSVASATAIDDSVYPVALPFSFTFDNIPYAAINVSSNGFITFGATAPSTSDYGPISTTTAFSGCVSAFGRDMQAGYCFVGTLTTASPTLTAVSLTGPLQVGDTITATGIPAGTTITAIGAGTITMSANATSTVAGSAIQAYGANYEMRYDTLGVSPNRVFVVQWKNFHRYGTGLTTTKDQYVNFQIRLSETSNVIDAVYGDCVAGTGVTTTTVIQVGLRGPNNTFATNVKNRLNVKGTSDWATSAAGTLNSSGEVFNTTAPANVLANGLDYKWQPAVVATNVTYGTGCGATAHSWYEQFAATANDLTGMTVTSVPVGGGGSVVTIAPISTYTLPTGVGLSLTDDSVSAAQPLGFTWSYDGGSTSSIAVDSNGRIFLNGTQGSNFTATVAALLTSTTHTLDVFHTDFLPDGLTNLDNVYFETDNVGEARVTWHNVHCYNAGVPAAGACEFQAVFLAPNTLQLRYQTVFNNASTNSSIAIVGFSRGGTSADPGNRDLTVAAPFVTPPELGNLTLAAAPVPLIGTSVVYTTSNIPLTALISAQIISLATIPAGVPIPGAPGCLQYVDLTISATNLLFTSPTATFSLAIPNDLSLVGLPLANQSASLVPGINPLQVITSNGIKSIVSNI